MVSIKINCRSFFTSSGIPGKGIHISDLKYWDSPVVETYRINLLPVLYLIDTEGRIMKKEFAPGDLREVLREAISTGD